MKASNPPHHSFGHSLPPSGIEGRARPTVLRISSTERITLSLRRGYGVAMLQRYITRSLAEFHLQSLSCKGNNKMIPTDLPPTTPRGCYYTRDLSSGSSARERHALLARGRLHSPTLSRRRQFRYVKRVFKSLREFTMHLVAQVKQRACCMLVSSSSHLP